MCRLLSFSFPCFRLLEFSPNFILPVLLCPHSNEHLCHKLCWVFLSSYKVHAWGSKSKPRFTRKRAAVSPFLFCPCPSQREQISPPSLCLCTCRKRCRVIRMFSSTSQNSRLHWSHNSMQTAWVHT